MGHNLIVIFSEQQCLVFRMQFGTLSLLFGNLWPLFHLHNLPMCMIAPLEKKK